jgi:hypothetical protein
MPIKTSSKNKTVDSINSLISTINSLNNNGGTIEIKSGTYNITFPLLIPSNVRLKGIGKVVFKRMANIDAILLNKSDGVTGGYLANENIKIENILFDANNPTYSNNVTAVGFGHCTNIEIKDCTFINCATWHYIELNGCKDAVIQNCMFDKYTGTSEMVQFDGMYSSIVFPWFAPYDNTIGKNYKVINCKFVDSSGYRGITSAIGNHTFASGVVGENILVDGCYFENIGRCLKLDDYNGITITNNTARTVTTFIEFTPSDNDFGDIKIQNNKVYHNNMGAEPFGKSVYISTSTKRCYNVSILDNVFDGCATTGLDICVKNNCVISGNTITNCKINGMNLYGGDVFIVSNNNLKNNLGTDIAIGNNASIPVGLVNVNTNVFTSILQGTNVTSVKGANNIYSSSNIQGFNLSESSSNNKKDVSYSTSSIIALDENIGIYERDISTATTLTISSTNINAKLLGVAKKEFHFELILNVSNSATVTLPQTADYYPNGVFPTIDNGRHRLTYTIDNDGVVYCLGHMKTRLKPEKYVTNGLVLNLLGTTEMKTVGSDRYWSDTSTYTRDCLLSGFGTNPYDSTNKAYLFGLEGLDSNIVVPNANSTILKSSTGMTLQVKMKDIVQPTTSPYVNLIKTDTDALALYGDKTAGVIRIKSGTNARHNITYAEIASNVVTLVWNYGDSTLKYYHGNTFMGSLAMTAVFNWATMTLGLISNSNILQGKWQVLRFYNRPLTEAEIAQNVTSDAVFI